LVDTIRADLQQETHLVDEIIVVHDRSIDATAASAAGVGAMVIPWQCQWAHNQGRGRR
jgi:phosphoglycolate phosphatase-like HAD superfamily hydrolase